MAHADGGTVPAAAAGDGSVADKRYVVKADRPGVDPRNVEIAVHENVLTLRGQRKEEREEK